ncbi:SUMF1/EgtB/PvdO family nonheme iron enzyme [Sunxiuqinia indica]|uniref:SUMF1/EgtB/PvdO family nonheme iron enzyme n=1 Tax=Sunxiuqinia indica TaxID=2692584 RepID=UPI0013595E59|nr:SUMF1/EgtB/PvdO family nonheme iron enzyme [Sunxiuqinia indica]
MKRKSILGGKRIYLGLVLIGVVACVVILQLSNQAIEYTSTDDYCMSCHVHPHAEQSWKLSTHYNNSAGVIVHCVECHLPPKGHGHLAAKAKHGFNDVYGMLFKDSADYNWEDKRKLENAKHFVYKDACLKCHQNLFPTTLSTEGDDAHLYYLTSEDELRCINCHLHVGHYDPNAKHEHNLGFGKVPEINTEVYEKPTEVTSFSDFTEKIPGTSVSFEMVAVPGATFTMGSPKDEPLRDEDEGPVFQAKVSDFWMAKVEVSWDEYLAFFKATSSQGRKEAMDIDEEVDGITGPTPPWGAPDQGWGKGAKPAITMSWHAANTYCRWLSQVTGKKYRLPTEAEWEYACRAGQSTPYPFKGNPKDYSSKGILRKIFSPDTAIINSFVAYEMNSEGMTVDPAKVKANAFGLKNLPGNVAEFCLDYYDPHIYQKYSEQDIVVNPRGPQKGREHVIRGGSFKSDAKDVRCAARDYTKTKAWLMTDPQMPKSIWWYSDVVEVGFRVVCEVDETLEQ